MTPSVLSYQLRDTIPGLGLVGGEALLHHIALGRRGWSRFGSGST
jgi:hypothetical protein